MVQGIRYAHSDRLRRRLNPVLCVMIAHNPNEQVIVEDWLEMDEDTRLSEIVEFHQELQLQ